MFIQKKNILINYNIIYIHYTSYYFLSLKETCFLIYVLFYSNYFYYFRHILVYLLERGIFDTQSLFLSEQVKYKLCSCYGVSALNAFKLNSPNKIQV